VTRLRLRHDAIWREADGEVIAVDNDLNTYVSTNVAGTLLWRSLSSGASRQELIDLLVAEFGISSERADADVDVFLADLRAQGFLAE
jgi:hypothetical protein